MSLKVRFWGTRGSIPSPGPGTVRYGGNTPCLELRTGEGWLIILDAGTGIRELGRSLLADASGGTIEGDVFLTHAHWDHIQGLPFFAPMFRAGNHFTIWGSKTLSTSVDRVVRDQMSPVVFPVSFEELAARVDFRELTAGTSEGRGYEVRAMDVRHPGGALGYRFQASGGGGTLSYISDNELDPTARYEQRPEWRDELVRFIGGSDVLVHDAMYTAEEYEQHRGWGHSTYGDAVNLALDAEVTKLVLFHHKPERTDDELDDRLMECREMVARRGGKVEVVAAAEGLSLVL